jgi:acyl-CoA dehydrogenase
MMHSHSEAHSEIREEVAKLCSRFPDEYWRKLDEVRSYPTEFVPALTEAGWLAALIPEEYGGSGLPLSAAAAILEEIQRQGCNGAACHAQMYIMGTILRHGSDRQKSEYLPKIASGELRLQAFGVTEPTSGTDTTALRTFAKREGDKFIVNGQKIWTSRAEHSDLMLLLARTTPREQVQKKTEGISTFIVDMRTVLGNGLTIRPIRTMMNHNSCEVFFDNMEVPAENLVGEEGKGFRYILDGMNAERLLIASECIGDAKWFIEKAVNYAKERVLFGRPIGQNQGVQFPIARLTHRCAPPRPSCTRDWRSSSAGSGRARKRIWARCWRLMPAGPPARLALRPSVASASRKSMMWSVSSAKRAFTK